VTTGQQFDLLESAPGFVASDGDSMLPTFPRSGAWYPVSNGSTELMTIVGGVCSVDSGNH
jgi:hypothetical protein